MKRRLSTTLLAFASAVSLAAAPVFAASPCAMCMVSDGCKIEVHTCCTESVREAPDHAQTDPCKGNCEIGKADAQSALLPAGFVLTGQDAPVAVFAHVLSWAAPLLSGVVRQADSPKHSQAPPGAIYLFHCTFLI